MIISFENVEKSYGASPVLRGVSARIEDTDRIGLIGRNGAGKTTLLNILYGDLEPDGGTISRADKTFGFLRQNSGLSSGNTIWEEMRSVFAPLLEAEQQLRSLEQRIAQTPVEDPSYQELAARYAHLQGFFEQRDGYLIDVKIRTILSGMGFADTDPQTPVEVLSGGEKTRLAICKLLLEQPDLLILDEPTNHLDFNTLNWLEDYLLSYKGALLVVSHDRYFLDKICNCIWEVECHQLITYPGNYSRYVVLKEERVERQQKEWEIQQRQIEEMEDFIARNIVRASTTARAQSRRKALEKMELVERPRPPARPPKLRFTYGREPVKDVLLVENLSLVVGEGMEQRTLCSHVDLQVTRGEKIALVGANGIGKTTFLSALVGLTTPQSGKIEWGVNTEVSYFEQEEFGLRSTKTALDELWDRFPQKTERELRTLLGNMGLTGDDVYKKVGELSGGERAKLKFAILALRCGNVLVMDEPTNHLDLASKEALDKALQEYTGTLLVVSHDRYLLNKFPDKIAEMHTDGIRLYKGNYDRYLASKNNQPPAPKQQQPEKPAKTSSYRGKKQRSEEAARRREIALLEQEIEQLEEEIARLEGEIASPEVAADYLLLQQTCDVLEEKQKAYDDALSRWSLLLEES
ncbi:MAG: ABC-F family ATP-binding cassette domain-containing protein [Oscillospiraceae bacterium]|jgi:ATP-binding cassette subfamily F protein 3